MRFGILALSVLLLGPGGCASGPGVGGPGGTAPPSMVPVADETQQPSGHDSARAQSAADTIVASIRRSLAMAGDPAWGEVLVSLQGLRNQSHASGSEFDRLRGGLAQQLTRAGRGRIPIRFVSDADEEPDYVLGGTAYLVTADGSDQWELFLSLRRPGESWTVWRAERAVRTLRQPRGGQMRLWLE